MNFLHKNMHKCKSPEPSRKIKLETLLVLNLTHSPLGHVLTIAQYTHDVVLTSVRRRFNVMNVVWMSNDVGYWESVLINKSIGEMKIRSL